MPALRAATAGPRALGGDGQKTRVLARDQFDAAARHRTELVHTPFYGVRCVTLQTSAATRSIHANCGRALGVWRDEIRISCCLAHGDRLHAGASLGRGSVAQGRVQALPIIEDLDV